MPRPKPIPGQTTPKDLHKRGRGRPKKVTQAPADQLGLADAPPAPAASPSPAPATPAPTPTPPSSSSTPAPAPTVSSPAPPSTPPAPSPAPTAPARPWWYGQLPYPHHVEMIRAAAQAAPRHPDHAPPSAADRARHVPYAARQFWDMAVQMAAEVKEAPTLYTERFQATFLALLLAQRARASGQPVQLPDAIAQRAKILQIPIMPGGGADGAHATAGLSLVSSFLAGGCQTFELDAELTDALMRTSPALLDDRDDPCPHLPYPCVYIAFTDRAPRHELGHEAQLSALANPRDPNGLRRLPVRGLYVWEARLNGELLDFTSDNPASTHHRPDNSPSNNLPNNPAHNPSQNIAPKPPNSPATPSQDGEATPAPDQPTKRTMWLFYAVAPPTPDADDFAADSGFWWILDWSYTPDLDQARQAFEQAVGITPFPASSILRPDGHGFPSLELALEHHRRTVRHKDAFDGHSQWALTCLAASLSQYLASLHAHVVVTEPQEAVELEQEASTMPEGKRKARLLDLAQRIRLRSIRATRILTPDKIKRAAQLQLFDEANAQANAQANALGAQQDGDDSPTRRYRRGHWVRGHIRLVWSGKRGTDERKTNLRFIFPFYRCGNVPDPEGAIDRNKLDSRSRTALLQSANPDASPASPREAQ